MMSAYDPKQTFARSAVTQRPARTQTLDSLVERLRSNWDTTCVIDIGARVVSIACDLFNKLPIGFEDLFIGDIEPNPVW